MFPAQLFPQWQNKKQPFPDFYYTVSVGENNIGTPSTVIIPQRRGAVNKFFVNHESGNSWTLLGAIKMLIWNYLYCFP